MKRSLRSWLWRVPVEQEVDEELALHLDLRTRELVERGIDPASARALALERMGDVRQVKQTCVDLGRKRDRQMHLAMTLEELWHDVVFAFRQLRAAPVFTLIAVTTLALGIGVNSAIFALVDATLLRPLPYADPDRLARVWETSGTNQREFASPLNMIDWHARGRALEGIAGYAAEVGGMVMAGRDGNAETVSRQWVTAGIFDVLGVTPIAGRMFTPDDDRQRANVVVISEAFWDTRFSRDPAIVGSQIRLDGELWTIVGIAPRHFELLGRTSLWAMRPISNLPPQARRANGWLAVGRLRPALSFAAAQEDLAAVAATLAAEFPQTNQGRSVRLEPLHTSIIGSDLQRSLLLFLAVVGFVLLICCANVANLLLARAAARSRELAVRSALGAGRSRVVRQLLTESVVLAGIGALAGMAAGAAILRAAPALLPEGLLPATVSLAFDARVMAFCAAAALLVGVLFGLAPAFQASSVFPAEAMGAASRTTTAGAGRLRHLLVAGEIAAAVLLLSGAGLLLRTLIAVESHDRGYRAENVLTMLVDPLGSSYPTPERLQQFYDQVETEVRAVAGVQEVAWSSALPLGTSLYGDFALTYEIVGAPPLPEAQRPATSYQVVSSTYFSTLDLPIVAGRGFDARETRDSPRVCIVNEAFARTLGGRSPIGLQVAFKAAGAAGAQQNVGEIVGVAKQVKGRPDEANDFVQIYVPMAHDLSDDAFLVVRARTERPQALTPAVRAAISRIDREQLVSVRDVATLDDIDWAATGRHRFRAVMVTAFAALAVTLAMVGVFGILAYAVQQRWREFGVRRALGASTATIFRLVAASAAKVVGAGVVVGLLLSAVSGRLIASMLFGVQPLDAVTFAAVTLLLGMSATAAVVWPAWRAASVEPAVSLRNE